MILIKPNVQILRAPSEQEAYKMIEQAARTCWKSEDKTTEDSSFGFVDRIINKKKHLAMAEFFDITVRFIVDRGITHELVRHRLCSFAQESTRYVNYGKNGNKSLTFIIPHWSNVEPNDYSDKLSEEMLFDKYILDEPTYTWLLANKQSQSNYLNLIKLKVAPQDARFALTHAIKTQIVMKANLREWINIFEQRTSKAAHPDMQLVMNIFFEQIKDRYKSIDFKG